MKKIIFGAMAAVALLACSKDQVIEQNRANDEITFSIVADNQTKANAVHCANNLMGDFYVYGTYKNGNATSWYFQGDHIAKVDGSWVNQTTTRYWTAGTHDFYAIVNGAMNVTAIDATPAAPTVNFSPATTVSAQKDLLYAVATGKTKSENAVALNFRHALSQIEFKAMNTNPQLYVEITDVKVGQTPGTGVFTFPTTSTATNFENHSQNTAENPALNTDSWTSNTPADYKASFTKVAVAGNNTAVGLTLSADKDNVANSMLLIPAKTTAWTPAANEDTFDGTYLAVKCKIYNVAGSAYAASDVCLHDGWAVIPVAFSWEPGKKYIYTFVFGAGNGGYNGNDNDPETDEPKPSDDPVLSPITYTVTVDDFQKGVDSDENMKF